MNIIVDLNFSKKNRYAISAGTMSRQQGDPRSVWCTAPLLCSVTQRLLTPLLTHKCRSRLWPSTWHPFSRQRWSSRRLRLPEYNHWTHDKVRLKFSCPLGEPRRWQASSFFGFVLRESNSSLADAKTAYEIITNDAIIVHHGPLFVNQHSSCFWLRQNIWNA